MSREWLSGAALALLLAGSASVAPAQHAAPAHGGGPGIHVPNITFTSRSGSIPFDLFRGSRVFVNGTVDGHATPMMLDTGASVTAVDRAYARSIGLRTRGKTSVTGAGGEVDAEIAEGVTLTIGNVRLDNLSVVVMDFEPIARAIGRPLPVVLGRDLFNQSVVGFNWAESRMTLTDPSAFKAEAGAQALDLGTMGPFRSIPLSVAGLPPIDAVLDLGNGGTVILPSDYWQKQPALSALPYAESQSGGIGGLHTVRRVTLPTVSLAGRSFTAVPGTLAGDSRNGHVANAANVGIDMLKAFDVSLDLGRSKIYLKPRQDLAAWPRERAGTRLELHGNRLKVAYVSPQGPAAAAGLKAGDEISAIDGVAVDPHFYASAKSKWNLAAAGTPVVLTRADGSTVRVTLRDYY